jgi:hypothetical protein
MWSDRKVGWLAMVLPLWPVEGCLMTTCRHFFTIVRTALFRQDLVRPGQKMGLNVPEPRTSAGTGPEVSGLIYRTFIDLRDIEVNHVLFVPKDSCGDRPTR